MLTLTKGHTGHAWWTNKVKKHTADVSILFYPQLYIYLVYLGPYLFIFLFKLHWYVLCSSKSGKSSMWCTAEHRNVFRIEDIFVQKAQKYITISWLSLTKTNTWKLGRFALFATPQNQIHSFAISYITGLSRSLASYNHNSPSCILGPEEVTGTALLNLQHKSLDSSNHLLSDEKLWWSVKF